MGCHAGELPDPGTVLDDVTTFVTLVKDGAYLAGDRRVHHTGRSKWRLTFRRLAGDALAALRAGDPGCRQRQENPCRTGGEPGADRAGGPGRAASLRLRGGHFRKPCSGWISHATIRKSHQPQKQSRSAPISRVPGCPARLNKTPKAWGGRPSQAHRRRRIGSVVDHQRADTMTVTYSSTAPGICRWPGS